MMSVLLELVDVSPSLAAEPLDVHPRRPVMDFRLALHFFLLTSARICVFLPHSLVLEVVEFSFDPLAAAPAVKG